LQIRQNADPGIARAVLDASVFSQEYEKRTSAFQKADVWR
jgi:hypothetical protein